MRITMMTVVLIALLAVPHFAQGQQVAINANPETLAGSQLQRPASLELERTSLDVALRALHRESGVNLLYSPSQLPRIRVSCDCRELTVEEALGEMLKDTRLRFQEVEDEVVIVPARAEHRSWHDPFVSTASLVAAPLRVMREVLPVRWLVQDSVVAGVVVDARTGQPIEGAQVVVEATNRGTVTGADGRFRIEGLQGEEVRLRVVRVGYKSTARTARVGNEDIRLTLDETAIALDEVVVTGNIAGARLRETPHAVTVITSDEIDKKQVQRINQLFEGGVPGIIAFDFGITANTGNVMVRGKNSMSGGYIKTYIDGIEAVNPSFAISKIDPNMIERIELIRGPQAATLYGSEAIGGVLQVFTKKGGNTGLGRPKINVGTTLGIINSDWAEENAPLVRQQRHNLELTGGTEDFSYNAGATYTTEGEWLPKYYNRTESVFGGMRLVEGNFSASAILRYNDQRFNWVFPIFENRYPDFWGNIPPLVYDIVNHSLGMNLDYNMSPNWKHTLIFGADQERLGYWRDPDAPGFEGPAGMLRYSSSKRSIRYNTTFEAELSQSLSLSLTGGLDYWRYVTDQFYTSPIPAYHGTITQGDGTSTRITIDEWTNTGYFAQARFGVSDALFLIGGVRLEDSPNIGSEYGLVSTPRFGATYVHAIGDAELKLRGGWGKAIRAPTPTHRTGATFTASNVYLPNESIGPEEQSGWEIGGDVYFRSLSVSATYYDQDVKGLIQGVPIEVTGTATTSQYQNVGFLNNSGWELEATWDRSPIRLHAAYSITNSTVRELWPGYTGAYQPGDLALTVPKNVFGGDVSYSFLRGTASVEVSRIGSWIEQDWMRYYDFVYDGIGSDPGLGRQNWRTYDPVVKVNLRLNQSLSDNLSAFVHVVNVGDNQKGQPYNYMITHGRTFLVGVRATY